VEGVRLTPNPDKTAAISSIVEPLQAPYPDPAPVDLESLDPTTAHILDLPHATRTYKLLLSGGHFNNATQTLHITNPSLPSEFASSCWDAITSPEAGGEENAVRLVKGNAMFVMVEMIEGLIKAGRSEEVKKILGGASVLEDIEASGKKGAGLLAEKIRGL
jgi:pumilio family protein 6